MSDSDDEGESGRGSGVVPGSVCDVVCVVCVCRRGSGVVPGLVDNLNSGHVKAAIIDVFDPEPLPSESKLWTTPNLMVMPHISADDGDTYIPLTLDLVMMNMRRYIANESLNNLVSPELGY